jgi:hypothetical protein
LSEATYPGVYRLQVTKFDIIDENEDGINEPGEHLIVHNIRVKNHGGMPSPENRTIQLLIQGTQFLEPIVSEPLQLPFAIQAGQEVEVPGILRAYIKNEWAEKPLGYKLDYLENVSIVGFFNQRLSRPLPFFCGQTPIKISYPLILDAPTYLDAVAKGDTVRFKWVLHNQSNKAYGIEGLLRRAAATQFSDPTRLFTLIHATADNPSVAIDELPLIEPKSMIEIDQDFTVNDSAMEYSEGNLTLELMLSDPMTGNLRSVQKHGMKLQISGVYSLSPNPSFLLVMNSKTPNYAVHQIIHLIRNRLHTSLDIFNLSLTGSYESPITHTNILHSYGGKSVIIFGSTFPYFGKVYADSWTLLDPFVVGSSLRAGTNFLFASVGQNLPGLKDWAAKSIFPLSPYHEAQGGLKGVRGPNAKTVISGLKESKPKDWASEYSAGAHQFTVKKGLFGSLQSTAISKAKSATKNMDKHFPLKRHMAFPDTFNSFPDAKTMGVIVCEGAPKNANLLVSIGEFPPSVDGGYHIADYHMFFIVSCLPFATRSRIFWNALGQNATNGLLCDSVYAGIPNYCNKNPGSGAMLDAKVSTINDRKRTIANVIPQVLEAISLSLQVQMASEVHEFVTTRPRFPDPLKINEKMDQLTQVNNFISTAPKSVRIHDIAQAQLFIATLSSLHAISNPLSFWQSTKGVFSFFGNRKGQLTPRLNKDIQAIISGACADPIEVAVKQAVMQRSKAIKQDIKKGDKKKTFDGVANSELAKFSGMQSVTVVNLGEENKGSVAMDSKVFENHVTGYANHQATATSMHNDAKRLLSEMVNPVDENAP